MSDASQQSSPLAEESESDESSFGEEESESDSPSEGATPEKRKKGAASTPLKKSLVMKPPRSTPKPVNLNEAKTPTSAAAIKSPHVAADQSSPPRKRNQTKNARLDDRPYNLVLPNSTETTLLIQLNDKASSVLEGATGAIGRIEVSPDRVVLDLQGQQYIGTLLPGPTAMLLGKHSDERTLKIEGITNDFLCTETLQSNTDMQNPIDFLHHEENVNRRNPDEAKAQGRPKKQAKKR